MQNSRLNGASNSPHQQQPELRLQAPISNSVTQVFCRIKINLTGQAGQGLVEKQYQIAELW